MFGPRAEICSRDAYAAATAAAVAFLEGRDDMPLETIQRDMNAASAATQFERAALRDKLTSLQWLREQLTRLQEAAQAIVCVRCAEPPGAGPVVRYPRRSCACRAAVLAP